MKTRSIVTFRQTFLPRWVFLTVLLLLIFVILPSEKFQSPVVGQSNQEIYLPIVSNPIIFEDFEKRPLNCNPSLGSGGLNPGHHEIIIDGQPVWIYISESYVGDRPTFLAFYLHGDEGGYRNPPSLDGDYYDWIYVSPQAPAIEDGYHPWNSFSDLSRREKNGQLIVNTFEYVYEHYNVCQNILFGSSISGGSVFLDLYFLPTYGDEYPAFINVNCGGSGIENHPFYSDLYDKAFSIAQNPDLMSRTELRYTIGTQDFLLDQTQRSIATYESLGFEVSKDIRDGAGHCSYGIKASTTDYWEYRRRTLRILDVPNMQPLPVPCSDGDGYCGTYN